ncbi:MAG: VCBS repeat-containing protein [bacterium]
MKSNQWGMLFVFTMLVSASVAFAAEVRFEKIVIDADSKGEAAAVVDVNRSGHLSIVCGESWYEPTNSTLRQWQKHPLRKIEYKSEYFDDFGDLVMDVNGDSYRDIVSGGWFCKSLSWYENPGKAGGEWKAHLIDSPGNIETLRLWDVTGDGHPAVVPNSPPGPVVWYELKRDAVGKGTGEFIKHQIAPKGGGHGMGFGDVNSDGRADIITTTGWWEAPVDRRAGEWKFHAEFNFGHASIPIQVYDVNGDGLADIIYGNAHGYGLYWMEQKKGPNNERQWERHEIDKSWSQAHVVELADIDGCGHPELVTGKRYRAHNDGDPGGKDPCCLYYYTFDKTGKFTRYTIDEGNKVGCGIDTIITDFNGDGRLDIICPGKGGLYLFMNQGVK